MLYWFVDYDITNSKISSYLFQHSDPHFYSLKIFKRSRRQRAKHTTSPKTKKSQRKPNKSAYSINTNLCSHHRAYFEIFSSHCLAENLTTHENYTLRTTLLYSQRAWNIYLTIFACRTNPITIVTATTTN